MRTHTRSKTLTAAGSPNSKKKPMPTKCGTAVVSDIRLTLSEGPHELQLDQQLATLREVGRQ